MEPDDRQKQGRHTSIIEATQLPYPEQTTSLTPDQLYTWHFTHAQDLTKHNQRTLMSYCCQHNHPIALLEQTEKGLMKFLMTEGTLQVSPDLSSGSLIITDTQEHLVNPIEIQDFQDLYQQTSRALNNLFDEEMRIIPQYRKYLPYLPESVGIAGLKPDRRFQDKRELATEDVKELVLFWNNTYRECRGLTRVYVEEGRTEAAPFTDRYPTAPFYIQALYRFGINDPNCVLKVNNLLLALDDVPSEEFYGQRELPWWKNPAWDGVLAHLLNG